MVNVMMFDLGDTLVDREQRPFPRVPEALTAIAQLTTTDGKPLKSCLVSDFTLATPPATADAVAALFATYLDILDTTGLRPFFEPVTERVTLSTHAGVMKPERAVFEKALRRLGATVKLDDCLFITENAAHVQAARSKLHMRTLQFHRPGTAAGDFDDWADAPAMIAYEISPDHATNVNTVVRAYLATLDIDLTSAEVLPTGGDAIAVTGTKWHPLSTPGPDDLENLHVAVPVMGTITRGPGGKLNAESLSSPSDTDIAEVENFVRGLARHDQIGGREGSQALHPSHRIETDAEGRRRLVRARYSAR